MAEANKTDMKEFWNGDAGRGWVRHQDRLDVMLKPFGDTVMDLAGPLTGADVLDIGCGCGDTTYELGRRVGASGKVTGLDISDPMLARARQRGTEEGVGNVDFLNLDAQRGRFRDGDCDIVFSRFGVMFFDDPVAAFSNLKAALKPDGRMAFVCWQPSADNLWVRIPVDVVRKHVDLPPPPGPEDPGEFAFGDADRINRIMSEAGFTDVSIEAFEPPITLAGGMNLDDTVEFTMLMGPASRAIAASGDDEDLRQKLGTDLRAALAPYDSGNGVVMDAACWIVSAKNATS